MAVKPINPMKTKNYSAKGFESTYALIVRSEEKERGLFEGAVYFAVVLSALFSLWQVAKQPVELPLTTVHTSSISQSAKTLQRA
jgi:RNAse (barnase) inhibitor barstar